MKNSMQMKRTSSLHLNTSGNDARDTPGSFNAPEGVKASGIYRSILDVFVYLLLLRLCNWDGGKCILACR